MTTRSRSFALDGDDAARELRDITRIGAVRAGAPDEVDATDDFPGNAARNETTWELLLIRGTPDEIR